MKKKLLYGSLGLNILIYVFCITVGFSGSDYITLDVWNVVLGGIATLGVLALIGIGSMFFQFSDESVKIFISIGAYIMVWFMFSYTTWDYMASIPFGLGNVIMGALTLFYAIGVIMTLTKAGDTSD